MLFSLQGVLGVFMNLVNEVLHEYLFKGMIWYLDDMLIYTNDYHEHVELVCKVLQTLYRKKLFAKLSKCHKRELDFLGYQISGEELKMDLGKVWDTVEWAPP